MSRPPDNRSPDIPDAVAVPRKRWRMQLVWLVPIVAVLIGGWLAVKAVLDKGPTITISFVTGEGLEAGKTKLKFKAVDIGTVTSVVLAPDHRSVIARAELAKDASSLLVEDTRFWVNCARAFPAARCRASARCYPVLSLAWMWAPRKRRAVSLSVSKRRL